MRRDALSGRRQKLLSAVVIAKVEHLSITLRHVARTLRSRSCRSCLADCAALAVCIVNSQIDFVFLSIVDQRDDKVVPLDVIDR